MGIWTNTLVEASVIAIPPTSLWPASIKAPASLSVRIPLKDRSRRVVTQPTTTIMLVDDEEDILAVNKKMLEKGGYAVHSFDNPNAALKHVREEGCKACILVVSDIRMPGMSGFELVRRIKEVLPDIKVILTSSFVVHAEEFHKVMPSLHVDDFVKKPFTSGELLEAIKRFRQGIEADA